MRKKYVRRILILSAVSLLLLICGLFLLADMLLEVGIKRRIERLEARYQTRIQIHEPTYHFPLRFTCRSISVTPIGKPYLMLAEQIEGRVNMLSILTGSPRLAQLRIRNGRLNLVKKDSLCNYRFSRSNTQASSAASGNRWRLPMEFAPDDLEITDWRVEATVDTVVQTVLTPRLSLKNERLDMTCVSNGDTFRINGAFAPANSTFNVHFHSTSKGFWPWPVFLDNHGAHIGATMGRLAFRMDDEHITTEFDARQVRLFHAKLNDDTLEFNACSGVLAGEQSSETWLLDSTASYVQVGRLRLKPSLEWRRADSIFALALNMPMQPAQNVCDALPKGGFHSFEGIRLEGDISMRIEARLPLSRPDSLRIRCDIMPKKLRIHKYGAADLAMMNGAFNYHPYWNNRSIRIAEDAPGFTPYDHISDFLKYAVLNAEDGAFFYHDGFNGEALVESAIENLKHKRFRRGGSTISMQLVKNVYLKPRKTLCRKVEELMLVWLLERHRLVPKKRMFEVYLNIIEWGPNVYGAREAAMFYFNKRPDQLSIEESIFLAAIVPHPRSFLYHFNKETQQLRDFHAPFFKLIGAKLKQHKIITEEQMCAIDYRKVRLRGSARSYLGRPQPSASEAFFDDLVQSLQGDDPPVLSENPE